MKQKQVYIYVIIPTAVSLSLIAMYFSGIDILQQIVAPRMPHLHPNSGREFGLLENLQNLYLLATLVMLIYAVKTKPFKWEKILFSLIAIFTLFIFLEEIDYGLHIYEYIAGIGAKESVQIRNFHNVGDRTDMMKLFGDIGMTLVFFFFPLILANKKSPFIQYFLPNRWFAATMISMVITSQFALFLRHSGFGEGGVISKNISEFRELTIYYIFMIYIFDLVYKRSFALAQKNPQQKNR